MVEQLNLVSKIHDQLYKVVRIVDVKSSEELDLSESFFMPQETEMEENIRASLAGMGSIFEPDESGFLETHRVWWKRRAMR